MVSAKPLSLVVLAAGMGSRYGGLKQIDPVGLNGETILDFSIYDALRAGFDHVVFVINREIESLFCRTIGQRIEKQCRTSYVYQELDSLPAGFSAPPERTRPWGTAHATMMARDEVHGPFAVINADDFYGRTAYRLLAEYLASKHWQGELARYCLAGFRLENTLSQHGAVSRGICQVDHDGFLTGVVERTRVQKIGSDIAYSEDGGLSWVTLPDQSPVSMNMWGFTPDIFDALQTGFQSFLKDSGQAISGHEYFLPTVVNKLLEQGKAQLKLLPTPDNWFGITYQQDRIWAINAIGELVRQGVYPPSLWPPA